MDVNRGGGHYLASIIDKLAEKHDVFLLVGTTNMPENTRIKIYKIGLRNPHYYYGFQDYFFSKDVLRHFEELQQREKFDLIHINQVIGSPIIKLKKFGLPIIYTIHHPVSKDKEIAISESRKITDKLHWWRRYFYLAYVQKKICKNLDNILTVSNASADAIAEDYGVPRTKISVIYNGIDDYFFQNQKKEKERVVISVGSFIHPRRGFPYLLEIYQKISQLDNVAIWDVGRRTKEQKLLLDQIPRLTQFGIIGQEKLLELYSKTMVHISCSLYEGFGFNSLEALAAGAAAVSFGVGGVTEVLQKIDPYLVVEPRNTEQMFDKIKFLLNDSNFYARVAGYTEKVKKYFSLDIIVPQFETLYSKISKK